MTTQYNVIDASLPNNMIALNSNSGQQLLNGTKEDVFKNELMIKRFKPQVNRTFCGPASLALLINGVNVAYRIKVSKLRCSYFEAKSLEKKLLGGEEILVDENDVVHMKGFKKIDVKKNGVTLLELSNVAMKAGFGVVEYFADDGSLTLSDEKKEEFTNTLENGDTNVFQNVEEFRSFCKGILERGLIQGLICNYNMASLGYDDYGGHHSPLAAYSVKTDKMLVLDVWPDTQPAWVDTELLFKAMCTVDSASGLPRGLLFIYELM